ncbi:hypothetical protein [Streptomyces sp. NPDC058632]|uniref:hypothetical protein n=1 Tax=Streptomyces sp. NPDC058632 TaxID=3346567 RepID=UPI00365FB422
MSLAALLGGRENLADYLRQVGLVTGIFCLASLGIGYGGAKALRLNEPQAIAGAMEVGIHHTTVALTIALSVLDNAEVAVPSAVYSVLMYVLATAFGHAVTRSRSSSTATTDRTVS